MAYRFATEAADHSDLASGRVIHGLPGHPAFPVRLADEVLRRCLALREARPPGAAPCTVYDPCCGAAYHLAVMGFLHRGAIRRILASDVDPAVLGTAERNLALLGLEGMDARIRELEDLHARYGKESHREALESASRLREQVAASADRHPLTTRVFRANALDRGALERGLGGQVVDVVFADVPYGWSSRWEGVERAPPREDAPPLWSLLEALRGVVAPGTVVAIASDKAQKAAHEGYRRLERFQVGRRRIVIVRPDW